MSKIYRVVLPGVEITNHEGKKIRVAVGNEVEVKLRTEEKHYLSIGAIEDPNAPDVPAAPTPNSQTVPVINEETSQEAVWSIDPVSVEAVHLAERLGITVEETEEKILHLVDMKNIEPVLAIRELYGELETEASPHAEDTIDDESAPVPTGELGIDDAVTVMFEDEIRNGVIHSIKKNGVICVSVDGDDKNYREFDKGLVERRTVTEG